MFLDHIPNNVVNWITVRNYGFSGAADAFIFISGYAAAILYAKIMLERGVVVGATRVLRRAWQLYAAFVVLFAIYIVTIGDVAARYAAPDIIYEFDVAGLVEEPVRIVAHGLLLQSSAMNLDVLQLYVVLMACFPSVLWAMLRKPGLTMAGSLVLYLAARQFEWNLPSLPGWRLEFEPVLLAAAVRARRLVRARRKRRTPIHPEVTDPVLFRTGVPDLCARDDDGGAFPGFRTDAPGWLFDAFNPNDRTNLAPYRVLHFIIVALFVMRFMPKDWPGLKWPVFKPIILCGQQSLSVFCVGVFLSFAGHFLLMTNSGSLLEQILVSVGGIAIMTLVAGYISWSKRQDHPLPRQTARTPSFQLGEPGLSADAPASGHIGRYRLMRSSR